MGRYSKKSTYQGSVYILIEVQEVPEATFDETGDGNFEKIDWLADPKKWPLKNDDFFENGD